jgi:glycosyltransferase involved in cell wall biosynthesis
MTDIAFVIWTLQGLGGSERVVYDIARKLDRGRYRVHLVSFDDGPLRAAYEGLGVRVHVIPRKDSSFPGFILRLNRIIRNESIRIANPHHFGPLLNTFVAAQGTGAKIVYTEHSRWQPEALNPLYKTLNRLMLRRADAVVAVSGQIRSYYLRELPMRGERVHLIPNGIDVPAFRRKEGGGLRQELGIGEDATVIGMVANLRPEKNHKLLIQAFSDLAGAFPDIRLLLAGLDVMDGEVQRFASKVAHGDRVLFLGPRDDVPGLLGIMDIFCLPSVYEGLPLTVLEAMAAGVPVVGSDVLGINEVIEDGVNGLLFRSGDCRALIGTLERLLKDPSLRARLSAAGRSFVEERYSLEQAAGSYDRLFLSLQSS